MRRLAFTFFNFVIVSFSLSFSISVNAVVIIGGDGTGNTTAPADDPGFANVGRRYLVASFDSNYRVSTGTGIFLGSVDGQHWILSADHVNDTPPHRHYITLGGRNYRLNLNSGVTLTNAPGLGLQDRADLKLFRINGNPNLPRLNISETTPAVGSEVTIIGSGWTRHPDQISWNVDRSTWPHTWTETTDPDPDWMGFKQAQPEAFTPRWGTNILVDPLREFSTQGFFSTRLLDWRFDIDGGENEGGIVSRDSGGGVFYKNGDEWELSGTVLSRTVPQGMAHDFAQATLIFGFNQHAADLSFYRDQIYRITNIPEPFSTHIFVAIMMVCWVCFSKISQRSYNS